MLRKNVVMLIGLLVLTLGASVAARAESKQEIDVTVKETMQRFTNANPAHAELLRKAVGVLVFPRITKAGAGIGGEHGDGALLKGGATVHYYGLTSASLASCSTFSLAKIGMMRACMSPINAPASGSSP